MLLIQPLGCNIINKVELRWVEDWSVYSIWYP